MAETVPLERGAYDEAVAVYAITGNSADFDSAIDAWCDMMAPVMLATTRAEQEQKAQEWEEDYRATLRRGGSPDETFPRVLTGTWRLAPNPEGERAVFSLVPVVSQEELPDDIRHVLPARSVVHSAEDLVHGACACCQDTIPVLGRSSVDVFYEGVHESVGMKFEIAVVHCGRISLQNQGTIRQIPQPVILPPEDNMIFEFRPHELLSVGGVVLREQTSL